MTNQRGFALVLTLLITALLVAVAAQFIDEVYVDTSASHNYVAGQQASILAESGVEGGVRLIRYTQDRYSYTTLFDSWAQPLKFEEDRGTLTITIEEEDGKLNLNDIFGPNGEPVDQNKYEIAVRLLRKLGLSVDLLDALADWIDVNDTPHPAGAETSYYNTLKPPYTAKNAPLDALEELTLIKGFNSQIIEKLRPYVTVYPINQSLGQGKINYNTAPKEIIAALSDGMTDNLVSQVIEYRTRNPFTDPSQIVNAPGMQTIGTGLSTLGSVQGTIYRIHSQAFVNDTSRIVEAVVNMNDGKFLYWREY